jgi:hypothetical protein
MEPESKQEEAASKSVEDAMMEQEVKGTVSRDGH